jgi:hypothetical protein
MLFQLGDWVSVFGSVGRIVVLTAKCATVEYVEPYAAGCRQSFGKVWLARQQRGYWYGSPAKPIHLRAPTECDGRTWSQVY